MASRPQETPTLQNHTPEGDNIKQDIIRGLQQPQKTLPTKLLYDDRGAELFKQVCTLDEYYLTRTEFSIMEAHVTEMAEGLGARVYLIEFGTGSGEKTHFLLEHLEAPVGYVPVDISREQLQETARELAQTFRELPVQPVWADYTHDIPLPSPPDKPRRRAVYFPGSTIGNFSRAEARGFMARVADLIGSDGRLLVGVDLKKDPEILRTAYDDAEGVTAAFNRNILSHVNELVGPTFDPTAFAHRAIWNDDDGRIEMHLEAKQPQTIEINGHRIEIQEGETICTEHSHKYTLDEFSALAASAGFTVEQIWTDEQDFFSVQLLSVGA